MSKHNVFYKMTVTKKANGRVMQLTFLDHDVMVNAARKIEREVEGVEVDYDSTAYTMFRDSKTAVEEVKFWF